MHAASNAACAKLAERASPPPATSFFLEPCVSELHKFLFDGLPVRGMIVRLTDAWTEILKRRAGKLHESAPYRAPHPRKAGCKRPVAKRSA